MQLGWGRFWGICLCLLALGGLGGCGGDSPEASADNEPAIPKSRPDIEVPAGLPPKKLVIKDLRKGTGAKAKSGDRVALQYYGIAWGSRLQHANSWSYSNIPVFKLGSDRRLLYGLSLAVPGMREGGSREVLIPNTLVYYPGVQHLPLNRLSALIYKVYLVDVLDRGQTPRLAER